QLKTLNIILLIASIFNILISYIAAVYIGLVGVIYANILTFCVLIIFFSIRIYKWKFNLTLVTYLFLFLGVLIFNLYNVPIYYEEINMYILFTDLYKGLLVSGIIILLFSKRIITIFRKLKGV